MEGYTYQTRKQLTDRWVSQVKEKARGLSETERSILPSGQYYSVSQKTCQWMQQLLEDGTYWKLSDIYKGSLSELTALCVPEEKREEFYYALDEMNSFQMTAGWYRRSVRSESYVPFVRQSILLLWAYSRLSFYGAELADVLTGQVDPETYDHARTEHWSYDSMLAAQIDRGEERTIQAVKDILLGEGNTAMISYELIRGIVKSKNEELYQVLGQFLLAARLQEGARQAVCETMDAGRPEAFFHLFKVIEDNDLVRYSSVKRAVSTWIGIFNEKSVDRITDKLVRLMGQCLRDGAFCQEQLASEDAVAISCGLWAKGFYDAQEAIDAELELIRHGTKHQKMTASYFNSSLQLSGLRMQVSKEVLRDYPEDMELAACFMPGFMNGAGGILQELVRDRDGGYYSFSEGKAKEPRKKSVTDLFADEGEARHFYQILRGLLERIPKKGIVLAPCIFPWHQVTMSQSDLAVRLCLLAWMLQDEALMDEAAQWIGLIGQGQAYSGSSRAAAARVLLYRPRTKSRRKVLFDLLHDPQEYAMKAAFCLVEELELERDDYLALEKNLKYKKGRAGTLALLKKQEQPELFACIGRLVDTKSEECHMGALDLALQVKKEDPAAFPALKPALAGLKDPTGREQVLLGELLGESSEAQDILERPGYGLYDVDRQWTLPQVTFDEGEAETFFTDGGAACVRMLRDLERLVEANKEREYTTAWGEEELLGNKLSNSRRTYNDPTAQPLDEIPFRELWEDFYRREVGTPEAMLRLYLYQRCRQGRTLYEKNIALYKKVFGHGLLKKAPFDQLLEGLRYGAQAGGVIDRLARQYIPAELKGRWALAGLAKLLSVLDEKNALCQMQEKRWNGEPEIYTVRATDFPIFMDLVAWLGLGEPRKAFVLRFKLQRYFDQNKGLEKKRRYGGSQTNYLRLQDMVQSVVRGDWDKDLFYKAVLAYLNLGSILGPVSAVEQKGGVTYRNAKTGAVNNFFGANVIKPVDGRYHYDKIGEEELPAMGLAHTLYKEVVPMVLAVELKRGEQPTPFSPYIKEIAVIYGIPDMIQILTALGKDTLQRGYSYRSDRSERRSVLSHLLSVSRPLPEETAADLKKALKGTDITRKRLIELAMYAPQWISLIEEHLGLRGLRSGCYYFMAHTSEGLDEESQSMVAKYTPLTPEELRDGAFDVNWFFEAYESLGEKDFKLLYDAAKYSSTGTAHGRARKYADAASGKVEKEALKAQIQDKRNKDLLMSIGLLPLSQDSKEREADLLDRYQFIQKFKKESKQFGAQRRASEGRAVDLAMRNLSVNAGFTDVTRLTLRMETKLVETMEPYFDWRMLENGAADKVCLKIEVDETGKSSLLCQKDGKALKSIPTKYKKDPQVLDYQARNKKLKEQYSRTRQMMEQAMEDGTSFQVWELLELMANPVVRPILEPLVMKWVDGESGADGARAESAGPGQPERTTRSIDGSGQPEGISQGACGSDGGEQIKAAGKQGAAGGQKTAHVRLGFLTAEGLTDHAGALTPLQPEDQVTIAHPFDLYQEGHWHEYQKRLFEKKIRQPFKQVFRELYVKLEEELEKEDTRMFAGNQIQPQKTVGALRGRRWVADYEDGLQKIYYKENIVARIYAMADWFSPSDIEAPTLEWVVFTDRKTFKPLKIKDVPDVIYSEVMRDVDLAVSVAHAGGVDPETSHSTIEMRRAIVECNLELFKIKNVRLEGNHAMVDGALGKYTIHLGSGVVHQMGNAMLFVVPVHSQHRGRIFLPFIDDDPKTAEIMSKILLFAEDKKIKDPSILAQIR